MHDTPEFVRPVPRWVRAWATVTVAVALLLLFVLGGFVTSFRVGMADPVWPTEPWFLVVNGQEYWKENNRGFLIEHTHRAAGWVVGLLVSVLAVGAWASDPDRGRRWGGLAAILFLLVSYGEFHRGMMKAKEGYVPGAAAEVAWPVGAGVLTVVAAGACLAVAGWQVTSRSPGRWARGVAVVALIAVMIQGLLGGFRVFLNDELLGRVGTLLAAYHGAFAQVVFAVLVSVVALAAPRKPGDSLPDADRIRLSGLAVALPVAVFVQLIWGVWVRHLGSPVAQRLHVLTAFVVTGLAVWLVVRALGTPAGRKQLGFAAYHLVAIVAVQILLGVEAWMQKFAAAGPNAALPPELRPITVGSAAVRTAHVVIGTALLASAVAFAIRVRRTPVVVGAEIAEIPEPEAVREPAGVS